MIEIAKRGRKSNSKARFKAIAEIIAKHGTLSSRKIAALLKSDYGIVVTHATVNDDLKHDLDTLSESELKNKKTGIMADIEELATDAFNIAKTDESNKVRLSAMDTYTKVIKTQAEVLRKFEEAKLERVKQLRPIYYVFIGEPTEADLSKIKRKEAKKDGKRETAE